MKCTVIEMCWPNADTVWKPGQVVEVTADQYALLSKFLKRATTPKVEKVVKDGAEQ